MRFLNFASAILATTFLQTQASPTPATSETGLAKRASYVKTSGTLFNIDGTTGYYAGTNFYPLAFLTNNADVDLVFTQLAAAGLKVLRVWGFNDITSSTSSVWFQSFISGASPVINTGTNGLQRLDYVVSSAESHGIKLIINFVNNWSDYGGMAAYNSFYGTAATPDLWYTSSTVQAQYKAYIKAVVSRYTTSTAIFAWELANEVRCTGCATTVITNWATSTSAYIKSLDSNHLVTLGDEGFGASIPGGDGSYPFQTGPGVDWVANLKISTIDFGTFHLYPSSWGEVNSWGNLWITTHAAVCVTLNKPCVLEEYGSAAPHATIEAPWQATALSTAGMAGDMIWQFGTTLSSGQTSDDGNTVYYGTSDWTVLITNHVAAVNAKNGGGSATTTAKTSTTTSKPSSTTSKVTSTTKTTTSAAATGTAVPKYGQCGGQNYSGSTVCAAGSTCTYSNAYYSQCL